MKAVIQQWGSWQCCGFHFSHPWAPYRCWSLPMWIPKGTVYKYNHYLTTGMVPKSFSKMSMASVKIYTGNKGREAPVTHRGTKVLAESSGSPLRAQPPASPVLSTGSLPPTATITLKWPDTLILYTGLSKRWEGALPSAGRVLASGNDSSRGGAGAWLWRGQ